jgi:hypothetical protein
MKFSSLRLSYVAGFERFRTTNRHQKWGMLLYGAVAQTEIDTTLELTQITTISRQGYFCVCPAAILIDNADWNQSAQPRYMPDRVWSHPTKPILQPKCIRADVENVHVLLNEQASGCTSADASPHSPANGLTRAHSSLGTPKVRNYNVASTCAQLAQSHPHASTCEAYPNLLTRTQPLSTDCSPKRSFVMLPHPQEHSPKRSLVMQPQCKPCFTMHET